VINNSEEDNKNEFYKACSGDLSQIKNLLENGMDIDYTDNDNKFSPLHYANLNGKMDTVEYLIDNGANMGLVNNTGDSPSDFLKKKNV